MSERFRHVRMSVVACALLLATLLAAYALFSVAGDAKADESESGRVALQKPSSDSDLKAQELARGSKIVGGTPVPDEKYPFMAFLVMYYDDGSVGYCGGSLIDTNSVLTAAHCVDAYDLYGVDVYVGRTLLSSGGQGVVRYATYRNVHPNYYGTTYDMRYDSAILTLNKPVKPSEVKPVRLADANQNSLETPGRSLTVAGWGTTSEGGSLSTRMREVSVPVISDSSARRAYPNSFSPAVMVAAGKAGKDSCQGDSGGPLFTKASGAFTQVGIVSYGYGCARSGYPGIYTEVNNAGVKNFIVRAARAPY